MAFDHRNSELYVVAVVFAVAIVVSAPLLKAMGVQGWQLGAGSVGCGIACYLLLLASLNIVNVIEWLKSMLRRYLSKS